MVKEVHFTPSLHRFAELAFIIVVVVNDGMISIVTDTIIAVQNFQFTFPVDIGVIRACVLWLYYSTMSNPEFANKDKVGGWVNTPILTEF